ncbi:MAG: hypothetical protein KDA61_01305 [Planctomycetales bacterium]|nr:hypothetical protein [Planctomycetales bacterium]
MRRRVPESNRRGHTLLEMLVYVSISTAIGGLALKVVHQTMFDASRVREETASEAATQRMMRQFRDDVHNAIDVRSVAPETLELALIATAGTAAEGTTQGEQVTWRAAPGIVERETVPVATSTPAENEATSSNGLFPRREQYRLCETWRAAFAYNESPARLGLTVSSPSSRNLTTPAQDRLHVEAVIGRWHRLTSQTRSLDRVAASEEEAQ